MKRVNQVLYFHTQNVRSFYSFRELRPLVCAHLGSNKGTITSLCTLSTFYTVGGAKWKTESETPIKTFTPVMNKRSYAYRNSSFNCWNVFHTEDMAATSRVNFLTHCAHVLKSGTLNCDATRTSGELGSCNSSSVLRTECNCSYLVSITVLYLQKCW